MDIADRYFCEICLKEINKSNRKTHEKSKSHKQWSEVNEIINKDYDFFLTIEPKKISNINIIEDNECNNPSSKANNE